MRLTKRKFLLTLGTGAVGLASLWSFRSRLREFVLGFGLQLPEPATTGRLSLAELETLTSLGEILVDSRDLSADELDDLKRHINERTETDPGYLSLFRLTVEHLDHLASGQFSGLPREKRETLARADGLFDYRFRKRHFFLPYARKKRLIRGVTVPDLIAGYYNSDAGWAVVGYTAFPGKCGGLTRYTQPEGQPRPQPGHATVNQSRRGYPLSPPRGEGQGEGCPS